jgi:hypothetical protein
MKDMDQSATEAADLCREVEGLQKSSAEELRANFQGLGKKIVEFSDKYEKTHSVKDKSND